MSAAGSQMRVVPEGLRSSTRVVKSKVCQPAGIGPSASRYLVPGNAKPADTMPAERRKSRRFIASPLARLLYCRLAGATQSTLDSASVQSALCEAPLSAQALFPYNATRAAVLLEGVARLSPATVEEPVPALAHGDFLRS